jgi:hypothetical protein
MPRGVLPLVDNAAEVLCSLFTLHFLSCIYSLSSFHCPFLGCVTHNREGSTMNVDLKRVREVADGAGPSPKRRAIDVTSSPIPDSEDDQTEDWMRVVEVSWAVCVID